MKGDVLQILLDHEAGCYAVRYTEGPSRDRILDLFGTDVLPLPWRGSAPQESVVSDLLLRSPDAQVITP